MNVNRNIKNSFIFDNIMLLRALILVLVLSASFGASAQKKNIAEALKALQAEDLTTSKQLIDSASAHPETKDLATTWYYKGFVYKKIYNQQEKSNKQSEARIESVNSFKRFFELDTLGELYETAFKSTKYLASTFYNDAATSLNPEGYAMAIENFERHKETMRIIESDYDFSSLEIQFYLVLGQVYNQIYEQDRETNKDFYIKTQDTYEYVIRLDSNNLSANYNLGILHYNEAVNIIKNLDYDLDLITLELIQDECVQLFKNSLPFMQKAYELNPKRKETLIGLSGIYFSLNEMEKSQEIQKLLEDIEKIEKYENQGGQ